MSARFASLAALAAATFVSNSVPEARADEQSATLAIGGLWCVSCSYILRETLADLPGVSEVVILDIDRNDVGTTQVIFEDSVVRVDDIIQTAIDIGYPTTLME